MVTMDMLEQDAAFDWIGAGERNTRKLVTTIQHQQQPFRFLLHRPDVFFFFWDEVASSKPNLHGGFFRK